jgi:hypothetical protein
MFLKTKLLRTSDAKIKEGVFNCWTSNKTVTIGRKVWRRAKWSAKNSMEIIKKSHKHLGGGIIKQKSIVIRWLILYNTTKL